MSKSRWELKEYQLRYRVTLLLLSQGPAHDYVALTTGVAVSPVVGCRYGSRLAAMYE